MLGGGNFTAQNKVLPGAYLNFVSLNAARSDLSERGVAAIAMPMNWGGDDVLKVTAKEFQEDSLKILGYPYGHETMQGLREIFRHSHTLYLYRLNSSGAKKAANEFATAKRAGTRGNDIALTIKKDVDDTRLFIVQTLVDRAIVDTQKVASAGDLAGNAFVDFIDSVQLSEVLAKPLTSGANGTVEGSAHQTFLAKMEKYDVNAIGCTSSEDQVKALYISYCKRMRDEMGKKLQVVVYNKAADYEGIVNVKNAVSGSEAHGLIYWVTGVVAGTAIQSSATNAVYDGEHAVNVDYTQAQLEAAVKAGEFVLHQVGDGIRVLKDINSLTTATTNKGEQFKANQTIRVVDQIANDIAALFNTKYVGQIPNDAAGRVSLWTDIVKHHENLQALRAIEAFTDEDIKVEAGSGKDSVVVTDAIKIVNAMEKLYMTVTIQ